MSWFAKINTADEHKKIRKMVKDLQDQGEQVL